MPRRAGTTIAAGRVVASFLVALGVCPFTESVTASDERDPPLAELLEPLPHGLGRHALPEEKVNQLAFLARQIGDHRPGEIDDNGTDGSARDRRI